MGNTKHSVTRRNGEAKQRAIAYHEAGHTVAAAVLDLRLIKTTIDRSEPDSLGHVDPDTEGSTEIEPEQETRERWGGRRHPVAQAHCVFAMAGAEAEKILLGVVKCNDAHDRGAVLQSLEKVGVPGSSQIGNEAWDRYEDALRKKAARLIEKNKHAVEAVALELLKHETLSPSDVEAILKPLI